MLAVPKDQIAAFSPLNHKFSQNFPRNREWGADLSSASGVARVERGHCVLTSSALHTTDLFEDGLCVFFFCSSKPPPPQTLHL